MFPRLRRFGLMSLLACASAGCAVDSFGYTPTCGPADPPDACREPKGWNDYAHVLLTVELTGIEPAHLPYRLAFIGLASDGDTVLRQLLPVRSDSVDLWVDGGKLRLKYLGLVDADWRRPTGVTCGTPEPTRDLTPRIARVVRANYSLVCSTS